MKYSNYVLAHLQKLGFKFTDTRTKVIEALGKAKAPLSTYDIENITGVPNVSVYRSIQLLEDLGYVHKVLGSKFVKCSIPEEKGCHHFMICQDCGDAKEYVDHSHHTTPSAVKNAHFQVKKHNLELYGLCQNCTL